MAFNPGRRAATGLLLILLSLLFVLSSGQDAGSQGGSTHQPGSGQEAGQGEPTPASQPECQNGHGNNADCDKWASTGECEQNVDWMRVNCAKSCKHCTTAPVTDDVKPRTNTSECRNAHVNESECERWKTGGECAQNGDWMRQNCEKTCGFCNGTQGRQPPHMSTECRNAHQNISDCEQWKSAGECTRNGDWMRQNCEKSCGFCNGTQGRQPPHVSTECRNAHQNISDCEQWKSAGECTRNGDWMRQNCEKSCGFCGTGSDVTQGPQPPPVSTECQNAQGNDRDCNNWASAGECTENADWMRINCAKSCAHCTLGGNTTTATVTDDVTSRTTTTEPSVCADQVPDCWPLVEDDMCRESDPWMSRNCRLSCRYCEPPPSNTTESPSTTTKSPTTPSTTTGAPVPTVEGVAATRTTPKKPTSGSTAPSVKDTAAEEVTSGVPTLRHDHALTVIVLIAMTIGL